VVWVVGLACIGYWADIDGDLAWSALFGVRID
jgi:hypothetical protein